MTNTPAGFLRFISVSVPFLVMLLTSCERSTTLSQADKEAIAKDVHTMLDSYFTDIRNSGLMAEFKYLEHSDDFFWIPPGYEQPLSYDSIEHILKRNAPLLSRIENTFDSLTIIPVSSDVATYNARIRSVVTDTQGSATTTLLIESGVLINRGEGWKLLNGQTRVVN